MDSPKTNEQIFDGLGIDRVRILLQTGGISQAMQGDAIAWVAQRDHEERLRESARAEESLSIARSAFSEARLATRIAISAIILSIIMAIKEIIDWHSR